MKETLLINQDKMEKWIQYVKIAPRFSNDTTFDIEILECDPVSNFDLEEGKIIFTVLNQLTIFIMVWCNIPDFIKQFLYKPNTATLRSNMLFEIYSHIKNGIPRFDLLLNVFTIPLYTDSDALNVQIFNIWKEIVEKEVPNTNIEISLNDYRTLTNFYNNCNVKSEDYEAILETLSKHFKKYNRLDI